MATKPIESVLSEKKDVKNKVTELLTRNGINVDDVGKINKISLYQSAQKGDDGDPVVSDLVAIQLSPVWETGPQWQPVVQAKPTVIKPQKVKQTPALISGWKTAVVLPDPQIGYRFVDNDIIPMHDETAINTALNLCAAIQHDTRVDKIINLGDFLDLTEQSHFVQEPAFVRTTQPALDYGHEFLARQRATMPEASLVLIEGNHDRRMQNFVTVNSAASFGIRRANLPEAWPVMSVPYLLRLDELDAQYIDAYPAGEYWINDKCRAIHGQKVRSSGSTANLYVKDYPGISTVFGHVHRVEVHYQTKHDRSGPVRTYAASLGCLCRVDGAVPSYNSGVGIDGRPATHWEDWQQAIGVIRYKEDETSAHRLEVIEIQDGLALYHGQEVRA